MADHVIHALAGAPFVLSCCSTADLSREHFAARGISYICFHFTLGGREYLDDLGLSLSSKAFYDAMAAGADTKTSQVTVGAYEAYFESLLATGKDLVHLSLSAGLSGSYRSACIAAEGLREKYPEQKIFVVDSLGASGGYGLLCDMAADLRDAGKSAEEVTSWLVENRLRIHHWFFSTDLTFYVKGGRISKASGWFGTALKICPLLNMNHEGRLIAREKIRTKPRVIRAIADKMAEHAEGGAAYAGKCYLTHSDCLDDAEAVRELVEEAMPALRGRVEIYNIGTVIGSHTGPGTVALFFVGDERVD